MPRLSASFWISGMCSSEAWVEEVNWIRGSGGGYLTRIRNGVSRGMTGNPEVGTTGSHRPEIGLYEVIPTDIPSANLFLRTRTETCL